MRSDRYADTAALKASGKVRDKTGRIIPMDEPYPGSKLSRRQRDELYQGHCRLSKETGGDAEALKRYVEREAARLGISVERARRIIGQGNGEWDSPNSRWWVGCSLE
ncbi:MAG: hypothetical protein K2Q09_03020 [Phycisphaerales bacterium]|nr:hypothetical protein [Phycisphaerales bacterium]